MKEVIFGPPGTGKTHTLLQRLGDYLEAGTPYEDIKFLSYTKKTVKDVRSRAHQLDIPPKTAREIFRTIHSECYHLLDLRKDMVVDGKKLEKFCEEHKIPYETHKKVTYDEVFYTQANVIGNQLFNQRALLVNKHYNLTREVIAQFREIQGPDGSYLSPQRGIRILRDYTKWKKEKGLIDYTDMLYQTWKQNLTSNPKILFVDEFQDLTPLQYAIIKNWAKECEHYIIAGDDDQTIYTQFGADAKLMLTEAHQADKITKLQQTYRFSTPGIHYAAKIINKIKGEREQKQVEAVEVEGTTVTQYHDISLDELINKLKKVEGQKCFLVATNHYRYRLGKELDDRGIYYQFLTGDTEWGEKLKDITNTLIKLHRGENINQYENDLLLTHTKRLLKYGEKKRLKERLDKKDSQKTLKVEYDIKSMRALFRDNQGKTTVYDIIHNLIYKKEIQDLIERHVSKNNSIPDKPEWLIGTIHSAKGDEFDTIILTDDLTKRFYDEYTNPLRADNIHRMMYVGITRMRKRLILIHNLFNSKYHYYFPTTR